MDDQDALYQYLKKLQSKEAVEKDMLQSTPLNQPPILPSISKSDVLEKLQEETKTEVLSKESLESSSDWSVLDPDDNLFDVFSDKETLTAALNSFFANKRKLNEGMILIQDANR
ncbi:hypothetical protein TSMEX_000340 [Taenia solium]|eukprot:TsM_000615900 transcript=TsM_000615900 gene=TsM_000615900